MIGKTLTENMPSTEDVLHALGLQVWFRYEKYREEFAAEDVVIAIDETPVGVFVELEGGEAHITRLAEALGRGRAEYVTDSYRELFVAAREARRISGEHMIFPAVPAT